MNLLFKDLCSDMGVDKTLIKDWEHLKIGTWDNVRLYYKMDKEEKTLRFYVVSHVQTTITGYDGIPTWENPTLEVEVMFAGYGFFDGIRHLYMHKHTTSKDEHPFDGYLYYPNMAALAEIFNTLRKLEHEAGLDVEDAY